MAEGNGEQSKHGAEGAKDVWPSEGRTVLQTQICLVPVSIRILVLSFIFVFLCCLFHGIRSGLNRSVNRALSFRFT